MMTTNTIINLLILGVGFFIGLIARSLLPAYFGEKGKNLATQEDIGKITDEIEKVQSQYSKDIEVLKAELTRQSHAHQVRFEHEFQILTAIWDSLVHLQKATGQLRPIVDTYDPQKSEEQRKAERLTNFADAYQGLIDRVEKNRPFYPPAIYGLLLSLIDLMKKEALDYWSRSPDPSKRGFDLEYWKTALKNSELIIASVDDICEAIRDRIAA